jgi:hypothetical protein
MLTVGPVLVLMLLLQVKHLVVDWLWQPAYECQNKGTYGHPGGLLHAGKNAIGTGLVFALVLGHTGLRLAGLIVLIPFLAMLDFLIHYHVDWVKMNLNARWKFGPLTSEKFWWLVGIDQFVHQVTYIFLIWMLVP